MKLDMNRQEIFGEITSMWKLNHTLLNNQRVKDEIKGKSENTMR